MYIPSKLIYGFKINNTLLSKCYDFCEDEWVRKDAFVFGYDEHQIWYMLKYMNNFEISKYLIKDYDGNLYINLSPDLILTDTTSITLEEFNTKIGNHAEITALCKLFEIEYKEPSLHIILHCCD